MPDATARRHAPPGGWGGAQKPGMVEPVVPHDDTAVLRTRPLGTRAVHVHLDAVPFRVVEVDRLADQLVAAPESWILRSAA